MAGKRMAKGNPDRVILPRTVKRAARMMNSYIPVRADGPQGLGPLGGGNAGFWGNTSGRYTPRIHWALGNGGKTQI